MRLIVQIYEEYVYSPKKIRYGLHKIRFLHFSKVFLAKNVHFSKFFDFCKGKNIIGKMQNKTQKLPLIDKNCAFAHFLSVFL